MNVERMIALLAAAIHRNRNGGPQSVIVDAEMYYAWLTKAPPGTLDADG